MNQVSSGSLKTPQHKNNTTSTDALQTIHDYVRLMPFVDLCLGTAQHALRFLIPRSHTWLHTDALFENEVLVPLRWRARVFLKAGAIVRGCVALFAVLWVTNVRGPGTGFVPVLLYTLVIGNLTMPIMNLLAPVSSRLRFPFNWVAYLIFYPALDLAVASAYFPSRRHLAIPDSCPQAVVAFLYTNGEHCLRSE